MLNIINYINANHSQYIDTLSSSSSHLSCIYTPLTSSIYSLILQLLVLVGRSSSNNNNNNNDDDYDDADGDVDDDDVLCISHHQLVVTYREKERGASA